MLDALLLLHCTNACTCQDRQLPPCIHVSLILTMTRNPTKDYFVTSPLTGKKSGTWKRCPFVCGRVSRSSV